MKTCGWYGGRGKRVSRPHFFFCGESCALPNYGGSYGGGSDRGSNYANSICGKIRLREIRENLKEKPPIGACKLCKKAIESKRIKAIQWDKEQVEQLREIKERQDAHFAGLDLTGKIMHIAFHYYPPLLSYEEKEDYIRKLLPSQSSVTREEILDAMELKPYTETSEINPITRMANLFESKGIPVKEKP